ncbi:uncharacterized protein LOC131618643 [Vicia villosa]|uniref:uncharacterized protein LOC131618643 n=1 Tax=Vicia villosa TaxID=3911 RepID=UPI00273BE6A4|nr:uncharacterized protein LOC131618643 [Vicia villosa]
MEMVLEQLGVDLPLCSLKMFHDNFMECEGAKKSGSDGGERMVKKLRMSKALTISEGTSVSDACRRMAARCVDAVLLPDSNALLSGTMTDKDIATRVIAEGLWPDQTMVSKWNICTGYHASYYIKNPAIHDIVTFRDPTQHSGENTHIFIKRIVVKEGDTIEAVNVHHGVLYVNGVPQEENFVIDPPTYTTKLTHVPKGHIYVMGDNRYDSHVWGPLHMKNIVGRYFHEISSFMFSIVTQYYIFFVFKCRHQP